MASLVPVLILLALTIVFAGGLIFAFSFVGPKPQASRVKALPYECGIEGSEPEDTKISVKFYLVAILFIIFDVEIIFMYPWALVYREFLAQAGGFILGEMLVFMSILVFGLFYVWKARALEWD